MYSAADKFRYDGIILGNKNHARYGEGNRIIFARNDPALGVR